MWPETGVRITETQTPHIDASFPCFTICVRISSILYISLVPNMFSDLNNFPPRLIAVVALRMTRICGCRHASLAYGHREHSKEGVLWILKSVCFHRSWEQVGYGLVVCTRSWKWNPEKQGRDASPQQKGSRTRGECGVYQLMLVSVTAACFR